MAEERAGDVLGGRYRLIEVIGSGGMGRVWKGHDEQLNRPVAVKEVTMATMPAAEREERLTRAEREGQNAARLADHPNIVTTYDVVIEDGVPWTVMQLVQGRSLQRKLADGPLSVDAVARIAEAMLTALKAAHDAGVVHRDVKPSNILMGDDDRVLLTDFGIARAEGDQTVTVSGAFVGSLAYVAPERAEGKEGGPASDLFSLGATLFEAVEGTSPFSRDSTTGTLTAILLKPLPPMDRAGRLAPLITALTQKEAEDRPSSDQALRMLKGKESNWKPPSGTTKASTKSATPSSAGTSAALPWPDATAKSSNSGRPKPGSQTAATLTTGLGAEKSGQGAILAFLFLIGVIALGVYLYHQHHGGSNPMAEPTYSATYQPPAPVDTPTDSPTDSPTPQPSVSVGIPAGCNEAIQAMKAYVASQQGAPTQLSQDQAHTLATEVRGYADNLDSAANVATDTQVHSVLTAMAMDNRTMADDLDAYNFTAFHSAAAQENTDANSLPSACGSAASAAAASAGTTS
jgi:eukaryotic-like serine/threonine-protein kinase